MQCNAKYLITLRPTLILQIKQNNTDNTNNTINVNNINNTNKHTKMYYCNYLEINIFL